MAKEAEGERQLAVAIAAVNSQSRRWSVWECRASPRDAVVTGGVTLIMAAEIATKNSGSGSRYRYHLHVMMANGNEVISNCKL